MRTKKKFKLNDLTLKYGASTLKKLQHKYLNLPGNYLRRLPNEVVMPNADSGRVDEFYIVSGDMIINLEEESKNVTLKTLKKFAKYKIFGSYIYSKNVYTAVLCHQNPKNFPKEYQISPTDILRPHYIYFSQNNLWEKYENLINKIEQKIELDTNEILDIAFIPKFISKNHKEFITQSIAKVFNDAIINDEQLKINIAILLSMMILKNIPNENKQNQLMEEINMRQFETDMDEIVYEVYGDKLDKKDKQIEKQKQETQKYKQETQKYKQETQKQKQETQKYKQALETINKIPKNPPETKKIIQKLLQH